MKWLKGIKSTLVVVLVQKVFRYVPDKIWLQFKYFCAFSHFCDFCNPKTFNEKLQWLKLNNRDPKHTEYVDKYLMKRYITEKFGNGYVIPLLGVWDSVEEIDFDILPEQFVLKTTHDCAGLVICKDKSNLDVETAKRTLTRAMKSDYYVRYREWPYKNVVPRIIAEAYMVDESGVELKDYKVFCFNGEPYCMLCMARQIAKDEPFVRVDFYSIHGRTYVGEITFFPASGYGKFVPEKYDRILGDMIHLPINE